jgi:FkbM family methyltransferase
MNLSLLQLRLSKTLQAFISSQLLKALLRYRVLSCAEHRKVLSADLSTVVDIGANRGQFALAARRWAFNANVTSFEPLSKAADIFRCVFRSDPKVTFHQTAIGVCTGKTTIHISAQDDSSSLLPISSTQERLFPGTGAIRTELVEIGPLSNYVTSEEIIPPAMLKLDVQGYELEALRGCEDLLDRFDYVYVECSFMELYSGQPLADDIVAWLGDRGWRVDGIHNVVHDRNGARIQADFLFQNTECVNAA